jgi:nicotinamidase-related amidase
MAANLGFECLVVSDATATFERQGPDGRHWPAQEMHDSALASLHDEFAEIVTTAEVLADS